MGDPRRAEFVLAGEKLLAKTCHAKGTPTTEWLFNMLYFCGIIVL